MGKIKDTFTGVGESIELSWDLVKKMFGKSKTEESEILEVCRDIKSTLDNQIKSSPEYSTKLTIKEAFHFSLKSWEYELNKTKFHADTLFASSMLVGLIFVLYIVLIDTGNKYIIGLLACLGNYLTILFLFNMCKYVSLYMLFEERKKDFVNRDTFYFNVINEAVNMMNLFSIPKKTICSVVETLNKVSYIIYVIAYHVMTIVITFKQAEMCDWKFILICLVCIIPALFTLCYFLKCISNKK